MQRTADSFRNFLLGYEQSDDREAYTINALKDIDGYKEPDTYLRRLNNILWVQTMGSQMEFPYGKCIHHTESTHVLVYDSIANTMKTTCEAIRQIAVVAFAPPKKCK